MKLIKALLVILSIVILSACRGSSSSSSGSSTTKSASISLDFSTITSKSLAKGVTLSDGTTSVALQDVADASNVILKDLDDNSKVTFTESDGLSTSKNYKLVKVNEYGVPTGNISLGTNAEVIKPTTEGFTVSNFESSADGSLVSTVVTNSSGTSTTITDVLASAQTLSAAITAGDADATKLANSVVTILKKQATKKKKTLVIPKGTSYTIKLILNSTEDVANQAGAIVETFAFDLNPSSVTTADAAKDVISSAASNQQKTTDLIDADGRTAPVLSAVDLTNAASTLGDTTELAKSVITEATSSTNSSKVSATKTALTTLKDAINTVLQNNSIEDITALDLSDSTNLTALNTALGSASSELNAAKTAAETNSVVQTAVDSAVTTVNKIKQEEGETGTVTTVTVTVTVTTVTTVTSSDVSDAAETDSGSTDPEKTTWTGTEFVKALQSLNTGELTMTAFYTKLGTLKTGDSDTMDSILDAIIALDNLNSDDDEKKAVIALAKFLFGDNILASSFDASSSITYAKLNTLAETLVTIYNERDTSNFTMTTFYTTLTKVNDALIEANAISEGNVYVEASGLASTAYLTKTHIKLLKGQSQIAFAYALWYSYTTASDKSFSYFIDNYGTFTDITDSTHKTAATNWLNFGHSSAKSALSASSTLTASGNLLSISQTAVDDMNTIINKIK